MRLSPPTGSLHHSHRDVTWRSFLAALAFAAVASMLLTSAHADERDLTHLLLTWQRDPTTTMTVQWIEAGEPMPLQANQSDDQPTWQMPHVGDVALDGTGSAWQDDALHVAFLADEDHRTPERDDLSAAAWLAWNDQGLLLLVDVTDDVFVENPADDRLWDGDGIEVFLAAGSNLQQRYQLQISPGVDTEQPEPRHRLHDNREDRSAGELTVNFKVRVDEQRYRIEALLPWANLGVEPAQDENIAFQLYVNDKDALDRPIQWMAWFPRRGAADDPSLMETVTLADTASAPVRARFDAQRPQRHGVVGVYGLPELAGETVAISATDQLLATGTFEHDETIARAEVALPEPPDEARWGALHARLHDQHMGSAPLPPGLGQHPVPPAEVVYFEQGETKRQRVQTASEPINAWSGMYRQRVEITDLQPGTAYRFRVQDHDRELGFHTMPATLEQPLRFAIGGDTRHRQRWMEQTNKVAMAYEPAFIVWGGDLAYADALPERLYRWEEWFQANHNTLIDDAGFVTPIVVGIGNHEVQRGYYRHHDRFEPTAEWRARIAPYFYSFFAFPGQPGYGVLDFGEYLSLVMLDSDHTNPIPGEQTQWLNTTLAERQGVPHVFPVYHVPAYPSHRSYDGRTSRRVREHWVPLFEAHHLQLVVENHDHTYKRTEPIYAGKVDRDQGITYIGDGAWGVSVRPVHDAESTWYLRRAESKRHAIIVTLSGDDSHVLVVSEDGDVIDTFPESSARTDEH